MKPAKQSRTVFDASAVLALLQGEPGAERLCRLQPKAVVNAVNAAEVLAKLIQRGVPPSEAQAAYDALPLETEVFDEELVRLSAGFAGKGVSLGDRCFLAAAQRCGSGWTSDRGLVDAAKRSSMQLSFFR